MKTTSTRKRFTKNEVLRRLRALADPRAAERMAYFGIRTKKAYGISAPKLKWLAREIGRDHALSQQLWSSEIHEARILAALIGEPKKLTAAEMDRWCRDFDSWDVVDGACCYLFAPNAPLAWRKAVQWTGRTPELEKRAGFALMAYLAYKDKTAPDAKYLRLLSLIRRGATDDRNFVRKAVNWALRQIGKRNRALNRAAIGAAEQIRADASRYEGAARTAALWVAADTLRELRSPAVQRRLRAG